MNIYDTTHLRNSHFLRAILSQNAAPKALQFTAITPYYIYTQCGAPGYKLVYKPQ